MTRIIVDGRWYVKDSGGSYTKDRSMAVKNTRQNFECNWASVYNDPITYGFKGWTTDPNSDEASFEIDSVDGDATYYAVYKLKSNVEFMVDGGGDSIDITFISVPEGITITGNMFSMTGAGTLSYETDSNGKLKLMLRNTDATTKLEMTTTDRNYIKILNGNDKIVFYENNIFTDFESNNGLNRKLSDYNFVRREGSVLYQLNGDESQTISVDGGNSYIKPFVTKIGGEYYPNITFESDVEWIVRDTDLDVREDDDNEASEIPFTSQKMADNATLSELESGRETIIRIKQEAIGGQMVNFPIYQRFPVDKTYYVFKILNYSGYNGKTDEDEIGPVGLAFKNFTIFLANGRKLTIPDETPNCEINYAGGAEKTDSGFYFIPKTDYPPQSSNEYNNKYITFKVYLSRYFDEKDYRRQNPIKALVSSQIPGLKENAFVADPPRIYSKEKTDITEFGANVIKYTNLIYDNGPTNTYVFMMGPGYSATQNITYNTPSTEIGIVSMYNDELQLFTSSVIQGSDWLHVYYQMRIEDDMYIMTINTDPNNGESERIGKVKLKQNGSNNEMILTFNQSYSSFFEPIEENTTGQTSLTLLQYYIGTNGTTRLYFNINQGNIIDYNKIMYSTTGTSFAQFDKNNTGGINVTQSSGLYTCFSLIDDYGLMYMRYRGYGGWQGGGENSAISSNDNITATPLNLDNENTRKTVVLSGEFDEDNDILLRGQIVNKAIRVPSNGFNNRTIKIEQYPYSFDSETFYTDPAITYLETDDLSGVKINETTFNRNGFSCEFNRETSLDYNLTYNIAENTTDNYKQHILIIGNNVNTEYINRFHRYDSQLLHSVMLHFIQEYKVKNRIYYGGGFGYSNSNPIGDAEYTNYLTFDDKYNEEPTDTYKYNTWFETCSSMILKGNEPIMVNTNNIGNNTNIIVAYPNDEFFEYEFGVINGGTSEILTSNYKWGDRYYTVVKTQNNKSRFTKK